MVIGSKKKLTTMKYPYPDLIAKLKAVHEHRMNVTAQDEYYYKEPMPLTDEQKEHILQVEEDAKKRFDEKDRTDKLWKQKNYEGTELRDHYNH